MGADYITRAREGDFAAFEHLVAEHEGRLYRIAMRILRHREDAEDAVQGAFLTAIDKLDSLKKDAAFGAWLRRIVTNNALKILRKRGGLQSVSLDAATDGDGDGQIPHPEFIADWNASPAQAASRREVHDILERSIHALPESHRLVFILRDGEGLSIEETARALKISPGNVKVRLLRARLAMREQLTRVYGDASRRVTRSHDHDGEESTTVRDLLMSYEGEPS